MTLTVRSRARSAAPTGPADDVDVVVPEVGLVRGWAKLLTRTDPSQRGAFQLLGHPLRPGSAYRMPSGALVLIVDHDDAVVRTVRLLRAETGGLVEVKCWVCKSGPGAAVARYAAPRLAVGAAGHTAVRAEAVPNRWPGRCVLCTGWLKAGAGEFHALTRTLTHTRRACPPPPESIPRNRFAGRCFACGNWVGAGAGAAVRRPDAEARADKWAPIHHAPCPPEAVPGPPNRGAGWCHLCSEFVAPGDGFWLRGRLSHAAGCPAPVTTATTWLAAVRAYRCPARGQVVRAEVRTDRAGQVPPELPGFRVLQESYVQLVGVVLEAIPARRGWLVNGPRRSRHRIRVRAATPAEAADLLATELAEVPDARRAAKYKARFTCPAAMLVDPGPWRVRRPWIAEIIGRHEKYEFDRRFIAPDWDWREVTRRQPNATLGWTLTGGRLYEACIPTDNGRELRRTFLAATADGDVEELTRTEVETWLNTAAVWPAT